MNQKGVIAIVSLFIVSIIGSVIAYNVIKNDKFNLNVDNPDKNWKWEDSWNQPNQPNKKSVNPKVDPQPLASQITASSYDEAIIMSGEHGMPILAIFGADWCGWCTKMKDNTLSSNEVKDVMVNYILVYVNIDQNRNVSRKFGISGIPAYVITNSQEKSIKKDAGYKSSNAFSSWLNEPNVFKQPKVQ